MQTPVFVKTYDFLLWLLPHTAKFPKTMRHTVTNRLESAALDLQGALSRAVLGYRPSQTTGLPGHGQTQ